MAEHKPLILGIPIQGLSGLEELLWGFRQLALPNYDLPEIQVHRQQWGYLYMSEMDTVIRNLAIFADDDAGVFSK